MGLNKTKIAIIGAGYMADEYLKVLSQLKNIEIVGICNRTQKNSNKLKKKYKIPKIFNTIEKMYNATKPDGVIIAVSPEIIKSIAQKIFKHPWKCLFEKPIGVNFKESKFINKLLNKNNVNSFIGLNRRFYASTKYLLNEISKDKLKNRIVEIQDQEDQNLIKHRFSKKIVDNYMYVNSIHLIDYFNLICRGNIKKIVRVKKWQNRKKNIFTSYLYYSSGDIGVYRALWNLPGPWSVKVFLEKGSYILQPIEKIIFRKFNSRQEKIIKINDRDDINFKPGLKMQVNAFINAINSVPNKLPKITESFRLMKLINKIYQK